MQDIRYLRSVVGLSRPELARFLGVSEATIVRWEADAAVTEPRGLQSVLLRALFEAGAIHPREEIARIVRSCCVNHREAIRQLLLTAADQPGGSRVKGFGV